jgi:hypothetical protein
MVLPVSELPHVAGNDGLDVLSARVTLALLGGLHDKYAAPANFEERGSHSSAAATARMSPASAASLRHNTVSAAWADWLGPPPAMASTAAASREGALSAAAMKR